MLAVLSVFLCAHAVALPVKDLYTAEILVPANDNAALGKNARQGMSQVLIRVSGATDVGQNPTIAAALDHPADYYYQYGFEATDETIGDGDQQIPARMLRIAFEPSAVARLLRQAGYPVWGSNRPAVLVWVAVSEGGARQILTDNDKSDVMRAVQQEARLRGLPLLFPLMDLEDSAAISTAQIWGMFLDQIDAASVRYNPDVVIAARIQVDSVGQWSGSWNYRIENHWQAMDDSSPTVTGLVNDMVDHLANDLAHRYAVDSSRGSMLVRVEAIKNLKDYAAASAYLQSLTPVVDLNVVEVQGDQVLFRLGTEGQPEQLEQIIGLDQDMVLVSPAIDNQPIQYRWIGK